MRKEYKVIGTSKVKPTGLPDGLSVQETEVEVTEVITTRLSREITVSENGGNAAHLQVRSTSNFTNDNVSASLNKDETKRLRDSLNEILGEGQTALRKLVDASGYADIWFEIDPDKFYNQNTRAAAQRAAGRGGDFRTLDDLSSSYGIKSITFE